MRVALQARYDAWSKAYMANDVDTLLSILAPDYTLKTSSGTEIKRSEYEATRQGLFTSNIAEAGAFLRTGGADGPPNLQGFFLPYCLTESPTEAFQPHCHGITFAF